MRNLDAPLLWRVFTFIVIFLVISGTLGPRIISGGIVNRYGFGIYGGAGKALLFNVLCLLLMIRRKARIILPKWHASNLAWLMPAIASYAYAWAAINQLLHDNHSTYWITISHAGLLASLIFAAGACFGPASIRTLCKAYRSELLLSIAISVIFLGWLYIVYDLWRVLAATVIHAVSWLLNASGLHTVMAPPRTLILTKFAIGISQYCSGIDSIALFSGLYAVIGLLDWHRFEHRKFLGIFWPAILVLFSLNILRVYSLILAGYYINPHIAFSLFHTYAGMIFFIIYAAIFWRFSYRWMLQTKAIGVK